MDIAKATDEPRSFWGQTLWLVAAKGIALILALVLPLILVRRLEPEQLGLYRQSFQILTTTLALLCLQVSATAYYFTPREPERKHQVALNVLVFYLGVGSVVAALFSLFPRWVVPIFNGDGLVPVVPLIGGTILLWIIAQNLESVMIANSDIRWSSGVTVAIQFLKTSLLIAAAVIGGTVKAIMVAALITGIIHCSIYAVYLRQKFVDFGRGFDWQLFKAQLANALPFGIGGLAYIIQFDLHNYYVSYHFTPAEFAVYSIGCFQLPMLQVLIESVEAVLLSEASRLEKDGAYQQMFHVWTNAMRMLAFAFFPICAMLYVLRHEFILTLFTAKYVGATQIFAVNLINILLYVFLIGTVLRALPEMRFFRIKFCLFLLPLTSVALYVGIKYYGMVGAIGAVALTRVFDAAVTMTVVSRRLKVTRRDLWKFAPLGKQALVSAAAAFITLMVKIALEPRPVQLVLVVCCVVFGISYVVLLFVSGAVTPEEQAMLRSMWQKFYQLGYVRLGSSSEDMPS
ncbi:MAG TPA: oligosaccharide flippase family protein [Blastocatellia bacterium]|nr:oligosaccharide flippase family protein [Blastocatellia bacterium]